MISRRDASRHSPRNNPCAQCAASIAAPDWVEAERHDRLHYLWKCTACDYQFQTIVLYSADRAHVAA